MNNLKFIGRICLRIKKFFTPAKWETIWTSKCSGHYTWNGVPIRDAQFTVIVKLDKSRNRIQSYMTDGAHTQDIDLAYLVAESNKLADILKRNNISF